MKLFRKIFLTVVLGVLFAAPAYAALPAIVPACARKTGIPSLNCFIVLLATVANWILGISGGLAKI